MAHAASRYGIGTLRAKSEQLHERLQGLDVKQVGKVLHSHFRELLIAETHTRLNGSP